MEPGLALGFPSYLYNYCIYNAIEIHVLDTISVKLFYGTWNISDSNPYSGVELRPWTFE